MTAETATSTVLPSIEKIPSGFALSLQCGLSSSFRCASVGNGAYQRSAVAGIARLREAGGLDRDIRNYRRIREQKRFCFEISCEQVECLFDSDVSSTSGQEMAALEGHLSAQRKDAFCLIVQASSTEPRLLKDLIWA